MKFPSKFRLEYIQHTLSECKSKSVRRILFKNAKSCCLPADCFSLIIFTPTIRMLRFASLKCLLRSRRPLSLSRALSLQKIYYECSPYAIPASELALLERWAIFSTRQNFVITLIFRSINGGCRGVITHSSSNLQSVLDLLCDLQVT